METIQQLSDRQIKIKLEKVDLLLSVAVSGSREEKQLWSLQNDLIEEQLRRSEK